MYIPNRSGASLHSQVNWFGKRTNPWAAGYIATRQVVLMSKNIRHSLNEGLLHFSYQRHYVWDYVPSAVSIKRDCWLRTGCCQKANSSWHIQQIANAPKRRASFPSRVGAYCSLERSSLWNQGVKLAGSESSGQRLSVQIFHLPHEMQKRYGRQQIPDQAWAAWHHTEAHYEVAT